MGGRSLSWPARHEGPHPKGNQRPPRRRPVRRPLPRRPEPVGRANAAVHVLPGAARSQRRHEWQGDLHPLRSLAEGFMRSYLYIWHSPEERRLVLSGAEFPDFQPDLTGGGGVVLLRHQFEQAGYDRSSRLFYAPPDQIPALAADNIYGYGDFVWADIGPRVN